jgi:hypothetical protein
MANAMLKMMMPAGVLLLSGSALAQIGQTVRASFPLVQPAELVVVQLPSGTGGFQEVLAGQFNWNRDAGNPGTDVTVPTSFFAYCIELTQQVAFNTVYDYTLDTLPNAPIPLTPPYGVPMGAAKADAIEELWGRFWSPAFTNQDAAAFQVALWEIVYDGPYGANTSTGGLNIFSNVNPATIVQANAWLAALDGTGPKAYGLLALTSPDWQDMLIPTPGAAVLLLGGAGLAMRRGRRN